MIQTSQELLRYAESLWVQRRFDEPGIADTIGEQCRGFLTPADVRNAHVAFIAKSITGHSAARKRDHASRFFGRVATHVAAQAA